MRAFHEQWVWVAVVSTGLVGLWGLTLAVMKRPIDRRFEAARAIAIVALLIQVAAGVVIYGQGNRASNGFHVFYGIVISFTLSFAYIYRSQLSRRPALSYGLLLLFVMGLGIRAWTTVV